MPWKNVATIRSDMGVKKFITDSQLSFASVVAESEIKLCLGADFATKKDEDNVVAAHAILTVYHALSGNFSDVKREQSELSPSNSDSFNEYFAPKDLTEKLNQLYAQAKTLLRPDCTLTQEVVDTTTTGTAIISAKKYTPTQTETTCGTCI